MLPAKNIYKIAVVRHVMILLLTCFMSFLHAQVTNTYWQPTSGTGNWGTPANWAPNVPNADSIAYIDSGGTAVVTSTTFTINSIHVGSGSNASGGLILGTDARISSTPVTASAFFVGMNANSNGVLIMRDNAFLQTQLRLTIGLSGTGALLLSDSAVLISNGGNIALNPGSYGSATVADTATWNAGFTQGFNIGGPDYNPAAGAAGFLTIKDSGTLLSYSALVGAPGATGTVKVLNNGVWVLEGFSAIGNGGSGLLEIRNNGLVVNGTNAPTTLYIGAGGDVGTVAIYENGTLDMTVPRSTGELPILRFGMYGGEGRLDINDQGKLLVSTTIVFGYSGGTGIINLNGGVLEAAGLSRVGGSATITFNSGTLRAKSATDNFTSGIPVVNVGAGGAVIDSNGFDIGIGGTFSGEGGFTKTGSGTLLLASAQDYAGVTTIENGVLAAGAADLIKNSGALAVDGTFNTNEHDQQINNLSGGATGFILGTGKLILNSTEDTVYSGSMGGAESLTKTGNNTLTLNGSSSDFDGPTEVDEGTLKLTANNALGRSAIGNNGILEIANGVTAFGNAISGTGVTKISSSGVNIAGTNTSYTGTWNVTGGGTVASQDNLGTGASVYIEDIGRLTLDQSAAGNYQWNNTLTGSGTLTVKLASASGTLSIGTAMGTNFQGTLELKNSYFSIDNIAEQALARAVLSLGAGNTTHVAAGPEMRQLGDLTLDGGLLQFGQVEPLAEQAPTILKVEALNIISGSVQVDFKDPSLIPSGTWLDTVKGIPLLMQDEGETLLKLIAADDVTGNATGLAINGNIGEHEQTHNLSHDGVTTDAVATYDYVGSVGTANDGLYISYGLKQLDIKTGRTLILDGDDESDTGSTLGAKVTGNGNLAINANGWIALDNTNNDYTGTTSVISGTLKSGANNALGQTGALVVENGATFDLGGYYQNTGAFNGREGSFTTLGSGTLELTANSESRGILIGNEDGNLIINSPTLAVHGANVDLHSKITIMANAGARLNNAQGLGDGIIAFEDATATLAIFSTTDGRLENTLVGTGRLVKEGGGTLTIQHANNGYDGAVNINEGRLIGENIAALNTASVNVASGAVYELSGASGTLGNTVTGPGTFTLTNNAKVEIHRANAISPTLDFVVDTSEVIIATGGLQLGNTRLNRAKFTFAPGTPKTASITRLDGANSILSFNVDFDEVTRLAAGASQALINGGLAADYLQINESAAGNHGVMIMPTGAAPGRGASIELIRFTDAAGDDAQYHLVNASGNTINVVDIGLNEFALIKGGDSASKPDAGTWYLWDVGPSNASDAIIATSAMIGKDWHYSMDALHQRMGEVRMERNSPATEGNINNLWVRSRGYRLKAGNGITGRSFDQYGYGITAGADRTFIINNAIYMTGAFVDMGRIECDFSNHGDGDSSGVGIGVYGTWLHNDGWYADLVLKADRQSHDFNAKGSDGRVTDGDYITKTQGVSVEFGYRFERENGWWAEPSVQVSLAWIGGAKYQTAPADRAIDVNVGSTRSLQYRLGTRFGRQLFDTKWHPYGKFAAANVDSEGGGIRAHERVFKPDYDGWRIEAAAGTAYRVNASSQAYFEYEYAKANNYERPWSFNLGYRILW